MDMTLERIEMALGAMAPIGPRDLRAYLGQPGPDVPNIGAREIEALINELLSNDPNHPARLRFSDLLRNWDNLKQAKWASQTARNTAARRKRIHELLQSGTALEDRIDRLLPFFRLEEPVIIAAEHQDWYVPKAGVRDYYWSQYRRYLRERRSWNDDAILDLDNTSLAIVECLADPEAVAAYASRGLVMGYVQSGKTANFTGVIARAADAGYRLVIVLAGTWNILRNQTQRRFDKELLGKELLKNDEVYAHRRPSDWDEFLEHGTDPAELGHYTWQRLTRPDIDFKRLKAAIDGLEFERVNKAAPLYHPSNLHTLPVKLLVVKKHSGILANLVKDLKLLQTSLTDIPALIIDDESDQAGLNTVDPRRAVKPGSERSKTNLRIVELLRLFPRGQYVGYTATPYANALVNPDDPEDLFPKDFLVSLERPRGYMGVSDFFDPETDYEDLEKDDFSQSEIAYIRRISAGVDEDDDDLKLALRSYVLAGGLKLYRQAIDPGRYRLEGLRHHTMLIHTSQRKGEHASLADRLEQLWTQCALNGPKGRSALEELWREDYAKVCGANGKEIVPSSFEELAPYLGEAIKRIEKGQQVFVVVNSDTIHAPDFSAAPVWKIIVGGNKLSRGYTIEGLTVSYYRRVAGTADTLMQMGRWFGFRPGYQDLVRVFLGVADGRRGETDLVLLFKEVCRMEEAFREEVKRYIRKPGARRITPKEIPPLVSVSGALPPTATNKMFNAVLASKNFGGRVSMLTLMPVEKVAMKRNLDTMKDLLLASKCIGRSTLGGTSSEGKIVSMDALVYEATNSDLVSFLLAYRWLETDYAYPERPADTNLQVEFLQEEKHGIPSWLIVAPQRQISFGDPLSVEGVADFAVKKRRRITGRGFQVFGEPDHRMIAGVLAAIAPKSADKARLVSPNAATVALSSRTRGVLLYYPVRDKEGGEVSVGFELFFPGNKLTFDISFTVRRKSERVMVER